MNTTNEERGPGWIGDVVVVETWQGRWAVQRTNFAGNVVYTADGEVPPLDGSTVSGESAHRILSGEWAHRIQKDVERERSDERAVFVCWQKERVHHDMLRRSIFGTRAVVDLYQLAWILVAAGEIRTRRIEDVATWCSVRGKLDDATQRTIVIRDCYFRMLDRFKLGLEVEGFGRALAQQVADGANAAIARFVGAVSQSGDDQKKGASP